MAEISVGQKMFMSRGGYMQDMKLVTVAKLTATQIHLEESEKKFNRKSMSEIGGDKYHNYSLVSVNDETTMEYNKFIASKKKERLIEKILGLKREALNTLSLEQLETGYNALSKK